MRKIASVIITTCIFAVNFVQNALPGPRNVPTHPKQSKQLNKQHRLRGVNRDVGKPVPANQSLNYGKVEAQKNTRYMTSHTKTENMQQKPTSNIIPGRRRLMDDGEHGDNVQVGHGMGKVENLSHTYGKIHGDATMPKLENIVSEPKSKDLNLNTPANTKSLDGKGNDLQH